MDINVEVKAVDFGSLKALVTLNIGGIEIRNIHIIQPVGGGRFVRFPSRSVVINGKHENYDLVRFTNEAMRQEIISHIFGAYDGAAGLPPNPPEFSEPKALKTKASPAVEIPAGVSEVAWALARARAWAKARANKSACAGAALAYIDAVPQAVAEGDTGAKTQILYILSNLGGWRGDEAKKAKAILNKATK